MQKSGSRFQFHNLLFRAGITIFCIGIISLIGAAVLAAISVQDFAGPIKRVIEIGVLLIWGGITIGTFFTIWIDLPQAGEPATYWVLFLLNQITGIILFGGLLVGVVGYWIDNDEMSRGGIALHGLGWVLTILRPILISTVMGKR